MEQRVEDGISPYLSFSRAEWAALRNDTPMTLTPDEVTRVRSLADRLDMKEVEEIYLPLSRLLSIYVDATHRLYQAQRQFLGIRDRKVPYIIGGAGAVAMMLMSGAAFAQLQDRARSRSSTQPRRKKVRSSSGGRNGARWTGFRRPLENCFPVSTCSSSATTISP